MIFKFSIPEEKKKEKEFQTENQRVAQMIKTRLIGWTQRCTVAAFAVDATVPEFKELWTVDMGLGYEHAPCIVAEIDGVVYAGSRRGIVTAIDPATQSVLWSLPLGVSEVNGIDIDPTTGEVYVSLIEGTVFRIAKK